MYNIFFWINEDNKNNLNKIENANIKNKNDKAFKKIDESEYLFAAKLPFIPNINDEFNIQGVYGLDDFNYVKAIKIEYNFFGDYNSEAELEIDVTCDIY